MFKFIHEITGDEAGGKAKGLKALRDIGLSVPDAFVIIHPTLETLDDGLLKKHLGLLGSGPKAVRSSAAGEDSVNASFAGQFDTFLNLHSYAEIKDAIASCLGGMNHERVRNYAAKIFMDADLRISIILQNMVNARYAGVVFSVNPVNDRRDKVLVSAVEGSGDILVGGAEDGVHYELFKSGSDIPRICRNNPSFLNEQQLREILDGARKAENHYGMPVDLEWAIDQENRIQWLQVRPVTSLNEVHYNELDTVKGESNDVWTLGNIGEMMPGVVTPLTYSVSAEAIDYGMTMLADKAGAFPLNKRSGKRYIQMFYNRLFINMSNMMDYPKRIWLNKAEDVQFALSGKVFPGITAKPEVIFPLRVINFFRQMISTGRAQKHLEDLRELAADFNIDLTGNLEQIHNNLDKARQQLGVGFGHHLMTSAQSGSLYSAFMRIMTGDKRRPDADDHHIATMLLLDIPDIESADAIKSLESFAGKICSINDFAESFRKAAPEDALVMLQKEGPEEIIKDFSSFIMRHGHRCVRESELREKTWEENPLQLIHALQILVRTGEARHARPDAGKETDDVLKHLPLFKRRILRSLMPSARKAVARREITKALSIKMVSIIRKAYNSLAKRMVDAGLLDDTDQVYFLTHEEIGMLLDDKDPKWKDKAGRRRMILPETDDLRFEEVCFGIPEPTDDKPQLDLSDGQLPGTPVSRGVTRGEIRIVTTIAEADTLLAGEIMVASFTDVGWTPYFSIISGLITEIGSPLSHGAVVAREYGIPAVVGAKGAKQFLKTGDMVILDGNRGIIEKI